MMLSNVTLTTLYLPLDDDDGNSVDEDEEEDYDFVLYRRPKKPNTGRRERRAFSKSRSSSLKPMMPMSTPSHIQQGTALALQQQIASRQIQTPIPSTFRPPMPSLPGGTPQVNPMMYPYGFAAPYSRPPTPQQPLTATQPGQPGNTPVPTQKKEEKKQEIVSETKITYTCCWDADGTSACTQVFENEEDLQAHVISTHFPEDISHCDCKWRGCTSLAKFNGALPRNAALNHFKLHYPLATKTQVKVIKAVTIKPKEKKRPAVNDTSLNLAGFALTSVLVLRNFARAAYKDIENGESIRNLFLECEGDFAVLMMIEPKFSRFVSQILGEMEGEDEEEL
jgi:hypothetical protein